MGHPRPRKPEHENDGHRQIVAKAKVEKQRYKLAVTGSAEGLCAECGYEKAYQVGEEIAKQGAILLNGATKGIPHFAAYGAKAHQGFTIGFSPAISKKEHVKKYALPLDVLDIVVYTGFNYSGRNLMLTRAADAVVMVCGRIGTLNEFTAAFEDGKLIGVLTHSGGMSGEIEHILKIAKRGRGRVIYNSNPKALVQELIQHIATDERVNFHATAAEMRGRDLDLMRAHPSKCPLPE